MVDAHLTRVYFDRVDAATHAPAVEPGDDRFDLFDKIVEEDPFPYSDRVHLDFLELFDDARIIEVLQRVHPLHRAAMILAYVHEYKAREIAEMTGRPLGTVLSWLHRGRRQLERELWEYAEHHRLLTPHREASRDQL
ncbi:MAG: sigma factor-like helix-turn-helix DNA-binding protein [Armatimonadota bacterium]|nr:sigma factor-like helix-turn-helix DNA-binding protein [Armatimonadota bacterium]MDR7532031.1 sigma factor-like helix-turn-helix DNA-binding protein [Armatimonadota bacterium]MDR7535962.1 sigma factor-like helix-turn-helix DNA-binding protein [Armatimonadota bacterium]